MKQYYTPKEYKELLSHLCIVCTTNEQKNGHVLEWFKEKGIKYEERSLKSGDYCFKIEACPELGFTCDTYFTDELFIERKNSLTELAGSINREAFHYELKRAQNIRHKYLIVEQSNGWEGILAHDYLTKYSEKSFYSTMNTFMTKYGLTPIFIKKEYMGMAIYHICRSVLDGYILKG